MRREPWLAIPMLLAGCVSHEQIDLTGKECPCGGEFTCDESSNTCRRSAGGGGPSDAGPRTDAGPRADTGGVDVDGGPDVDAGMMMMDMGTFVFEAEAGAIEAPMETGDDPMASGGSFVQVAPGMSSTPMAPATGKVTLMFDVAAGEGGTFRVWGRVIAPTEMDDSFWVRMDGDATWYQWNELALPTARPAWDWDDVHNTEMAGVNTPVTWELAEGSHTLDIAYREDGAQLDKVIITNDLTLMPMGEAGI